MNQHTTLEKTNLNERLLIELMEKLEQYATLHQLAHGETPKSNKWELDVENIEGDLSFYDRWALRLAFLNWKPFHTKQANNSAPLYGYHRIWSFTYRWIWHARIVKRVISLRIFQHFPLPKRYVHKRHTQFMLGCYSTDSILHYLHGFPIHNVSRVGVPRSDHRDPFLELGRLV